MRALTRVTVLAALFGAALPSLLVAQRRPLTDDADWLDSCRNRRWGNDHVLTGRGRAN